MLNNNQAFLNVNTNLEEPVIYRSLMNGWILMHIKIYNSIFSWKVITMPKKKYKDT